MPTPKENKAASYRSDYEEWKKAKLASTGYFIIFQDFKEQDTLKNISGSALKLYIYLGLHSGNYTGECWVTIKNAAEYFEKDQRTISYWLKELEDSGLIKRIQFNKSQPAHTFLQPY